MVIDLDHLAGEMDAIEQRGIRVGPENLSSRIRPPLPCRGTRYRTGWKKTALPERAPQDMPVRLSLSKIGEANILCARTRPKLIGGERAKYTEED